MSTQSRFVLFPKAPNSFFLNLDLAENEQDRDPVGGTDLHQGVGQVDGLRGRGGRGRGRLEDQSPSLARRLFVSLSLVQYL